MKQKAEITFEVEETIFLRQGEKILRAFCPQCQALVVMLTPRTIADFSNFTEREIFRFVEAGTIHFIETDQILICLNSIPFLEGEIKK